MNNFSFSGASFAHLGRVHPDLAKVARRAIEITPYDFGVVEGLRTAARQKELFAAEKTTTLKSLHLPQCDGFSHAYDIAVYANGTNVYKLRQTGLITEKEMVGYFRKVIQAHFTAAIELGVKIEAGGLWRTFVDSPHFQLNQKYYGGK